MRLLRTWTRALLALVGVATLAGCAGVPAGLPGGNVTQWTEEALLHDGTRLLVERTMERGGRREPGQPVTGVRSESLTFALPGGGRRLTWEDRTNPRLGGPNFAPLLVDVVAGRAYLVASPLGCLAYNEWGRPNPPYVVFRHDGAQWEHIALEQLPAVVKTPNLLTSDPDITVTQRIAPRTGRMFAPAETVRGYVANSPRPEFRAIVRERLAEELLLDQCPVMIRYKCGWGAPGEFNRKYFESACK